MSLESKIKDFSKGIGIDLIGITSAEPFNDVERVFIERVKKGYYRNLNYDSERVKFICNPKKILPDAKSIISIALSYNMHVEEMENKIKENSNNILLKDKKNKGVGNSYNINSNKKETGNKENTGIISKFARGIDYHKVLKNKLTILADFIKTLSSKNFKYKILVDTGPMVDRAVANRAGIGWYGKNCCIITKRFGSWIFLGEMITNLELQSDKSNFEDCGDCDLCIRACPTQAIISPYIIDTRKCISHLTQKKGEIPMNLLEKMGRRIYGCDICQDVCPYNKEAEFTKESDFSPILQTGKDLELSKLININESDYNKLFSSSAIAWIGRNTLRRNAIVASGNIADSNAIDSLLKAYKDDDEIIRKYANWAIDKIKDK